jgi:tetratricopeptide (TPR) repeat protein
MKRDNFLIKALFGRADVLTILGKYGASLRDFERISRRSKDHREKLKALLGIGNIYLTTGDTKKSYSIFFGALSTARKEKLAVERGCILNGLANVKIVESKTAEAKKYARRALAVYKNLRRKSIERTKGIAESFNNLGGIYSAEGQLQRALEYYMKSLRERKTTEDKLGRAIILNNIGVTFMDMRKYKKAREFLGKSMVLRKRIGFIQGIALCSSNIGIVCWKQRRYDEAMKYFQENIKMQRTLGDKKGLSTSLSNAGVAYKIRGQYKDAIRCHEESLKIRKKMGDRFGMTINLNQLGWMYLLMGEQRKATSMNNREKELCNEIKNLPRLMNYYTLRGNLLITQGRYREGYRHISKSLEISRRLHLEIDEACNLYDLGNILIEAIEEKVTTIGSVEMARKFFKQGMRIAEKYDHQIVRVLFLKGFSVIDLMEKRFAQAKGKIEEAERIVVESNFAEKLPSVLYLKATVLYKMKKGKEAEKAIERGQRVAKKLNMEPMVKKMARLKSKQ